MTKNPSNTDLQSQINGLGKRVGNMESKVSIIHDWVTEQKGYQRGRMSRPGISFSTSTGDFIIKLVTAVAVGVAGVLIGREL